MKANCICTWKQEKYHFLLDNRHGHQLEIGHPNKDFEGDPGMNPIELCTMSLAGCMGTIFAMMAEKKRIEFSQLVIDIEAVKNDGDATITKVDYSFKIKTDAPHEKIEQTLELTEKTCPIGVLFHNAGVEMNGKIEYL